MIDQGTTPTKRVKLQSVISVLLVLLGNTAALFDSVEKVNNFVIGIVGIKNVSYILTGLLVAIFLGYALGYLSLYKYLKSILSGFTKWIVAAVLAFLLIGAFYVNQQVLSSRSLADTAVAHHLTEQWVAHVFSAQAESGGFRTAFRDPTAEQQVWTSAQVLTAVFAQRHSVEKNASRIREAFEFIEKKRNRGGTDGWGYLDYSSFGVTEIAAWVTIARIRSVDAKGFWTPQENQQTVQLIRRDLDYLVSRQYANGGWSPGWKVTGEAAFTATRTYSTIMALWALIEARQSPVVFATTGSQFDTSIRNGVQWLLNNYQENVGWFPNPNRKNQTKTFPGLSAQSVYVLTTIEREFDFLSSDLVQQKIKKDFLNTGDLKERQISQNHIVESADQYIKPLGIQIEGSTFLWYPWTILAMGVLKDDSHLSDSERELARKQLALLISRTSDLTSVLEFNEVYFTAENFFCFSESLFITGSIK